MRRHTLLLIVANLVLTTLAANVSNAADILFSGYGTLGYSRSDQPYAYQRFIDDKGTFNRDSLFGVQMDAEFTPRWSATVQARLGPSDNHDSQWKPTVAWAFVSWRPDNDWLLRAGKLRIPGYLNSENMDIGTTFDYARLPVEMYSISPTLDFIGTSFNKMWGLDKGDISLEGYMGKSAIEARGYLRDGVPGLLPSGAFFAPVDIDARGLVLGYRHSRNIFQVGLHRGTVTRKDGQLWPAYWQEINVGGVGFYNLQPGLFGLPGRDNFTLSILSLGADVGLGNDVRLATEYAVRRVVSSLDGGLSSSGGYISLRKSIGSWTPYVYYARLRTADDMLALYQRLNSTMIPPVFPGAAFINSTQKAGADFLQAYDQHTWALGASYALSPTQKIKAEWQRTGIGITSNLVDGLPGNNINHQNINVFSLSYNFAF